MRTPTMNTIIRTITQKTKESPSTKSVFDAERTLSREDLAALADTIAARLPTDCDRVGIVMDHSVEMIAAILAVLKKGAAYVPAEPFLPTERIRFMMRDSGARVVITNSHHEELLNGFDLLIVDRGLPVATDAGYATTTGNQDQLAYILYTSGTTGRPKGIAVTDANVSHYVRAFQNEFHPTDSDIMLQHSVCSFDIFVEEVFGTLLSGAALAIPSVAERNDIGSLMSFIEKNHVTMLTGFPYLLQEMNELPAIPPSLRLLISGGDVIREAYVTNLVDKIPVYNTYGPTETTVCASYYNCSTGKALPDGTYPVGKPILGVDVMVMDEAGNIVPDGRPGELCILGGGVSNGYVGDREKENEAFVTLADGRRMYRSGDLGYVLPDGNIAFLHRKDTQIMILGKRVEVSEVENVLMQSGLVRQAHVSPRTDDRELSYMVAYVVPEREETTTDEIRTYLSDYLTDFMIPEFIVNLDSLPLTPNGKVDVDALPATPRRTAPCPS